MYVEARTHNTNTNNNNNKKNNNNINQPPTITHISSVSHRRAGRSDAANSKHRFTVVSTNQLKVRASQPTLLLFVCVCVSMYFLLAARRDWYKNKTRRSADIGRRQQRCRARCLCCCRCRCRRRRQLRRKIYIDHTFYVTWRTATTLPFGETVGWHTHTHTLTQIESQTRPLDDRHLNLNVCAFKLQGKNKSTHDCVFVCVCVRRKRKQQNEKHNKKE